MKVILLQDVKSLGKAQDIVEVSTGYANNMLFKKNLALEATTSNLNSIKIKKKAEAAKAQRELETAIATGKEMQSKVFTLPVKCGEGGRLYGAVTSMDIAQAIGQAGYKVDKRGITIPVNIKNLGEYEAEIKLHTQVTTKVKINVVEIPK
ncbi:MAG: 50S ribosomal protein L9 [Saccharofermentanales bacterium]